MIKVSDDVPVELLEEHEIPTKPVIYRGDKDHKDVPRHFIETVTEMALKIEKLLKTNTPIIFTDEHSTHMIYVIYVISVRQIFHTTTIRSQIGRRIKYNCFMIGYKIINRGCMIKI